MPNTVKPDQEVRMRTSARGKELIKAFEGLRLQSYKCPAGVWTIGYGHTATARESMTITSAEADKLLSKDLEKFELGVLEVCKGLPLTQWQFDALVSFTFNVGIRALKTSTLLKRLKEWRLIDAGAEFLRWNKAGGKVLKGLMGRRVAERDLFLNGRVHADVN